MAADSKDFEFRIRAADYSKKTFADLIKTLEELVAAQDAQLDSAKRGETSARNMERSLDRLRDVYKALGTQGGLTKVFEQQTRALSEAEKATEAARAAQAEYAKQIAGVGNLTKEQVTTQTQLAKALKAREQDEQRSRNALERTVQSLREYGIETDNIVAEQGKLASAFQRAEQAVERQDNALKTLDADLRAHKAAVAATAEQERQAAAAQKLIADQLAARAAEEQRLAAIVERTKRQQLAAAQQLLKVEQADQEAAARRRAEAQREKETLEQIRQALTRQADQAIATAKGYDRLAVSINQVSRSNFAGAIRDINDPAAAALKSISGLEASLSAAERRIASIVGPVRDYKATLDQLTAAQKGFVAVAGQIDAFRNQMTAVRAARSEYALARDAVSQLAAQMRAGVGGPEITQQMSRAQAELKRAAEAMRAQVTQAALLKAELRAAGVDTKNLEEAEKQLVAQANRTTTALKQLGTAVKNYGTETESAAKKFSLFRDEGRTTLSFMQRMRGELLALASAYIGVNAALTLMKDSIGATKTLEAINSKLSVLTNGDVAKTADEFEYLRVQVQRFGLDFQTAAGAYTKFAIAAQASGASTQATRFIFEQLALAANKARMSSVDFEGALKAVEQMMSKGKIQAEELRGQLADRLPGAFAIAAKGAGKTVAEFSKLLEEGKISSDYVIDIARALGETYGAAGDVTNGILEAENRFQTAVLFFKNEIAKSGLSEAYSDLLESLRAFLESEEGQKFAQEIGSAFASMVRFVRLGVENIDAVKSAVEGFAKVMIAVGLVSVLGKVAGAFGTMVTGGAQLVNMLRGLSVAAPAAATGIATVGTAVGASATGIATATRAVGLLTLGLRALARAIPFIGAALIAYDIYGALSKKTPDAERAGTDAGEAYAKGFDNGVKGLGTRSVSGVIGGKGNSLATPDPGSMGNEKAVYESLLKEIERAQKKVEKQQFNANLKGAKSELAERKRLVDEQFDVLREQANGSLKFAENREDALRRIQKLSLAAQALEEKKYLNEQKGTTESAYNKRIKLAEQLAADMERLQSEIGSKTAKADPTTSFDERLAARKQAAASELAKTYAKVEELGRLGASPEQTADLTRRLDAIKEMKLNLTDMLARQEELQRLEKEMNTQVQLRAAMQAQIEEQFKAGLLTEEQRLAKTKEINSATDEGIRSSAAALRAFAEANQALLPKAEYFELLNKIDAIVLRGASDRLNAQAQLESSEKRINDLLAERQRKLDMINAQREAQPWNADQLTAQENQVNGQSKTAILDAANQVRSDAMANMTEANRVAMESLIAQMDILIYKTLQQRDAFTQVEQAGIQAFSTGIQTAANSFLDTTAQMITGQMSLQDGFKAMRTAALQFFADFLKQIAQAILKQMLLRALQSMGPYGQAAAGAISATSRHQGGLVGNQVGHARRVDASWFAGAQRFHSGGLPGLRADEVPAILQKGEEVLNRDDPRNILNGGAAAGSGGGAGTRFVLVDDRSKVAEAMSSAEGENVIIETLRRNSATVRQFIEG